MCRNYVTAFSCPHPTTAFLPCSNAGNCGPVQYASLAYKHPCPACEMAQFLAEKRPRLVQAWEVVEIVEVYVEEGEEEEGEGEESVKEQVMESVEEKEALENLAAVLRKEGKISTSGLGNGSREPLASWCT